MKTHIDAAAHSPTPPVEVGTMNTVEAAEFFKQGAESFCQLTTLLLLLRTDLKTIEEQAIKGETALCKIYKARRLAGAALHIASDMKCIAEQWAEDAATWAREVVA